MHFLITAGGTREYIDPVRFISNASSGKMGYALAKAAVKAGHKVTLISTVTNMQKPAGTKVIHVETSGEMFEAVKKNFDKCDCLIMAAAVSDYKPVKTSRQKFKKDSGELVIKLKPTTDILKWAGSKKNKGQLVVGFALETGNVQKYAEGKLIEKKMDMVVANKPAAIGAEESTVWIKTKDSKWGKVENTSKAVIARKIIRQVERFKN